LTGDVQGLVEVLAFAGIAEGDGGVGGEKLSVPLCLGVDVVRGCRVQVQPTEGALVVEVAPDRELPAQSELDGCGTVAGPALVVMGPRGHDHMRLAQRVHAWFLAQAVLEVVQLMDEVSGGGPGLNLFPLCRLEIPTSSRPGTEARATSTIVCSVSSRVRF
jgi:hypothetical protein